MIKAHSSPDAAQANGIRLAGQKYFTLSANPRSIYGKKGVRPSLLCIGGADNAHISSAHPAGRMHRGQDKASRSCRRLRVTDPSARGDRRRRRSRRLSHRCRLLGVITYNKRRLKAVLPPACQGGQTSNFQCTHDYNLTLTQEANRNASDHTDLWCALFSMNILGRAK